MFSRIVVAVGETEHAAELVPVVTGLAKAFDSEVLVVHMRERIVTSGATLEKESIPESFRFGEAVARSLVEAGIRASSDIDSHRPDRLAEFIIEKADEFAAELIVVGSHHAHGLQERVTGDLGRKIVHGAHCPVLLMPSND
ncbi:MAG TPA: universal stress protein [Candidatus Dormibacteraeota bacterium]